MYSQSLPDDRNGGTVICIASGQQGRGKQPAEIGKEINHHLQDTNYEYVFKLHRKTLYAYCIN